MDAPRYPTAAQRAHPQYCAAAARRWPMIPYHNGRMTLRTIAADGTVTLRRVPCTACGSVETD